MTSEPFWKVRIALPGGTLHLASRSKPVIHRLPGDGPIDRVDLDLIEDTELGDSIGYIAWPAVLAVTFRITQTKPDAQEPQPQQRQRKTSADRTLIALQKLFGQRRREISLDEIVTECIRRGIVSEAAHNSPAWRDRRRKVRQHLASFDNVVDIRDHESFAIKPKP